jgi:hypothetical protein
VLPFVWSRNFYFRLANGNEALKLFTPMRPDRFRAAVTELGYPIEDLRREGFVRREERRASD